MAIDRNAFDNFGYNSNSSSSSYLGTTAKLTEDLEEAKKRIENLGKARKLEEEEIEKMKEAYDKKFWKNHRQELAKEKREWLELSTQFGDKLKSGIIKAGETLTKVGTEFIKNVDSYIGTYSKHLADMSTRLQGFSRTYQDMSRTISTNLASSPFVKQTEVLENLTKFVELGITQNVEQRAFLASVSGRIAKTFDNFDSSLIRIIKLQQEDSTVARLGLESSLNKFLNATFGDTSYLSSSAPGVRGSLLEAQSQLGVTQSAAVQYNVEKWLGALSALGLSSNAISQIGQGIGYLGSGNITGLTGNSQLQNLILMSSQKGNVDYASLLTGGLNAGSINNLFSGLIAIGQEMNQSGNLVLKNQLANLLGLSVSDLTAIGNLSTEQFSSLMKSNLTYENMVGETQLGLNTLYQRTSIKDMLENVMSNTLATAGEAIANNTALYGTYLASNMVASLFGNNTTVGKAAQMLKGGVVGSSAIYSIVKGASNLFSNSMGLNLGAWGLSVNDIISRGGNVSTSIQMSSKGSKGVNEYQNSLLNIGDTEEISGTEEDVLPQIKELLIDKIGNNLDTIITILSQTGVVLKGSHSSYYGMINENNSET